MSGALLNIYSTEVDEQVQNYINLLGALVHRAGGQIAFTKSEVEMLRLHRISLVVNDDRTQDWYVKIVVDRESLN